MSIFYDSEKPVEVPAGSVVQSISLPAEMWIAIDNARGDVARSRQIFRDLEPKYKRAMAQIRRQNRMNKS